MDMRTHRWAALVALLASLGSFFFLFLGWKDAYLEVPGGHRIDPATAQTGISVESSQLGVAGFGIVAALLAIAVAVLATRTFLRERLPTPRQALVLGVTGVALALATIVTLMTGDAHVTVVATTVEVGDTLWPAWAGTASALIAGLAALVPLGDVMRTSGGVGRTNAPLRVS